MRKLLFLVRRSLPLLVLLSLCAAAPALAQKGPMVGHSEAVQKNDHGLGFAVDFKGGLLGFAYRHYFGNTAVQLDVLPLYQDRGASIAIYGGMQIVNYALVWPGGRSGGLPTTTALRLTGGAGVNVNREQETIQIDDPNCQTVVCQKITQSKSPVTWMVKAAGGFGFEFGAVQRSGFSVAADLMMTVLWDDVGFYGAYPLPYFTLMYSW